MHTPPRTYIARAGEGVDERVEDRVGGDGRLAGLLPAEARELGVLDYVPVQGLEVRLLLHLAVGMYG